MDLAVMPIPLGAVRWLAPNPPATTVGHFVKSQSAESFRRRRVHIGVVAQSILVPDGKQLLIRDREKLIGTLRFDPEHLAAVNGSLRIDGALHTAGEVGIGTMSNAPAFKLDVAGLAHATGFFSATGFSSSSDDRFKTNVAPLTNVMERIRRIRGVTFDWNEKYAALGRSSNKRELGVRANEVKAVFPELVSTWGEEDYLAIDYGRLTAVLLEAVKELASEIESLRGRIDALEKPSKKSGRKSNE